MISLVFFFNDTATTEIYTLSLHDALPILNLIDIRQFFAEEIRAVANIQTEALANAFARIPREKFLGPGPWQIAYPDARGSSIRDRKSTRLNSSHSQISYAVFCLKTTIIRN